MFPIVVAVVVVGRFRLLVFVFCRFVCRFLTQHGMALSLVYWYFYFFNVQPSDFAI